MIKTKREFINMIKKTMLVISVFTLVAANGFCADEAIQENVKYDIAKEDIYRQEKYLEAKLKFDEANKLYFEGASEGFDYENSYKKLKQAINCYIKAKKLYMQCGTNKFVQDKVTVCTELIHDTYKRWALKLIEEAEEVKKDGKYNLAVKKYKDAIKLVPNSPVLLVKLQKLIKATRYSNEVSEKNVMPDKDAEDYQIDVAFTQGVKLYEEKMYDKARDKFEEVLALNPYHYQSISYIRKIYQKILTIGKKKYDVTRAERIAETEWKVMTPLIPRTLTGQTQTVNEPIARTDVDNKINEKLKNIIIDHIEFEEQTIPTVVKYLKQRSKQLDPEKEGVNIFLRLSSKSGDTEENEDDAEEDVENDKEEDEEDVDEEDEEDEEEDADADDEDEEDEGDDDDGDKAGGLTDVPRITMVVDDIPLGQALLYICRTANLKYRIEKYAIVIASQNVPLDDVETRIYPVEQQAVTEFGGEDDEDAVQSFFARRGVVFPQGARIVYDNRISRLIATNTPDNLTRIEEIIRELNVIDPQVLIQAKFVEVSQNDLESLGFEYNYSRTIGQSATARNPRPPTAEGQGSRTTYQPNDNILRHMGVEEGRPDEVFNISTISKDGHHFNWVVHALDQADSANVLSTPRITTLNGQEAVIRMVREVYYPEEWSEAELTSDSGTFVGSVPSFGDPTEIGIVLRVTPNVDADNYTISLDMNPVVQEFAGWTDYSYVVNQDGEDIPNAIIMPQISARTVETNVTIYDGETLLLGGIIRDQTSEINDKVPIIGDIPLIGRLFQSRGIYSQKTNLLIFLNCRLVNPDGSPIRERELRGLPPFRQ